MLGALLKHNARKDIIVVSFKQPAVDRFHTIAPQVPLAPGIGGSADFLLGGKSPGDGRRRVPAADHLRAQRADAATVTTADNVARAHRGGYAWHTWLSDDGEGVPTWTRLIDDCVDGVMTAAAGEVREAAEEARAPGELRGAVLAPAPADGSAAAEASAS